MPDKNTLFDAVVIGVSAGGLNALKVLCQHLPKNFLLPILIVQHQLQTEDDFLVQHLEKHCVIKVKLAVSTQCIEAATVYVSAAGYHLLVEEDKCLALSVDSPVNYSIPSIDVLFDSASDVYGQYLLGIILTGGSADGSRGLAHIVERGGHALVQSPEDADVDVMPIAAIKAVTAVNAAKLNVLSLAEIAIFLKELAPHER
ncbi:MAG: chemotaxis protein CheB [Pseudomonadales bacterium]|nr:chemotaxis protein CheB [Pseudomonadales bacterium]